MSPCNSVLATVAVLAGSFCVHKMTGNIKNCTNLDALKFLGWMKKSNKVYIYNEMAHNNKTIKINTINC